MNTLHLENQIRNLIDSINACDEKQYVIVSFRNDLPEYIYTSVQNIIKGKKRDFSYAYEDASGWCLPLNTAWDVAKALNDDNKDINALFIPYNASEYFAKNLETVHNINLSTSYPSK